MPLADKSAESIEVFFCYAHEDEVLRDQLEKQLRILQRQGLISSWHDRRINAGMEWEREIAKRLDMAQIILLLVSPDFIASDYCYDIEMKYALERQKAGKTHVIPIILRPSLWEGTPFSKLQALPTGGIPVTDWLNRDNAFLDIAKGLQKTARELLLSKTNEPPLVQGHNHNPIADNTASPTLQEQRIPGTEGTLTHTSESSLPNYSKESVKPEIIQKRLEPASSEPESEEIRLRVGRKHWWFLVLPLLPFIGTSAILVTLLSVASSLSINQVLIYIFEGAIGLLVILTGLLFIFQGIIKWLWETITITNKRIIQRSTNFRTFTIQETRMKYVQQIGVDQESFWSILLGYGTLHLYLSGGITLSIKRISQPKRCRDIIVEICTELRIWKSRQATNKLP